VERSLHKLATCGVGLLEQEFKGKVYAFLMECADEFIQAERKEIVFFIVEKSYKYKNGLGNAHPALCSTVL
jgi:hypothetical protein